MKEPELSINEFNRIAKYCSEEVRRQYAYEWDNESPLRVGGMIEAWLDAVTAQFRGEALTPDHIRRWGAAIEPRNAEGFRQIPIYVGYEAKMHWQLVDRAVEGLCESIESLDVGPYDAYREFEEIHPFVDGNGRTGKIILNWINGTLLYPIFPPNDFWGREIINP